MHNVSQIGGGEGGGGVLDEWVFSDDCVFSSVFGCFVNVKEGSEEAV